MNSAEKPHPQVPNPAQAERGSEKPRKPKSRNVVPRRSCRREIGENFADHRRELESMAGAGRSDDDVGRAGQTIDQEIAVGGHGVKAGLRRDQLAIGGGNVIGEGGTDQHLIL